MPMIDIQRRHQTIFRIRFGEKLSNRPAKLTDAIRVTSANPDVVDAFTAVYGGERKPWGEAFEAKLPTTSLNILVLPGQSVSQWWEKYRGSVCERRCDGAIESKSGKACVCDPDVEKRTADRNQCAPTTRVSVICPDVAVVGSGMFVCHGLVGAETLPQSIAVAEAALSRGLMVPAVLRVVEFRGLNHFIVPQIEVVGMSFNALTAATEMGELQHATRELEPPVVDVAPAPRFTPVSQPDQQLSVPRPLAEQYSEFDEQAGVKNAARRGRQGAAAPIPATGVPVNPRGAASPSAHAPGGGGGDQETLATDGPSSSVPANIAEGVSGQGKPAVHGASGAAERVPTDSPPSASSPDDAQLIAMWCADAGIGDDRRGALLHAFCGVTSAHDVPAEKRGALRQTLDRVREGLLELVIDDYGRPFLRVPGGEAVTPSSDAPASVMWKHELGKVRGVGEAKLLIEARKRAQAEGLVLPTTLDEIPHELDEGLRGWLAEKAAA